ncbi:MAG: dioxygenase [Pseudomonadota bacterium]|jgi:catechol 1,2-dioxygenase|nr:dioxygenase [Pseudomonadota bacterium]
MIIKNEKDVTRAALEVMERTTDPRLRKIMTSLIEHLHGFIRDVELTEKEFRAATELLNDIGQQKTDTHNEMVLMAGSLGVSSLVCLLNNGNNGQTETSQSMLGPFWRLNSPRTENGESIVRSETPGARIFVNLCYVDTEGSPLEGVEVDVWHASTVGLYESQDPTQTGMNLRGKFITDETGRVWFSSIKPSGYPIPTDGVVGKLLAAQSRHPFRPAHLHALAFKEGFKTLISQIFSDDDEKLGTDAQFGVTEALIARYKRHDEPNSAEPSIDVPWYTLNCTLVMEPGKAELPQPPIK